MTEPRTSRHKASVTFFSPDRGGRAAIPTGSAYRPHARTPEGEYLGIQLHEVPSTASFDTELEAIVELVYEGVDYAQLLSGRELDLVEGTRPVGKVRLKNG
ncbi:MAG: hypothetical protein JNK82_29865 [Myxococcaceae bacterium]|nr:hypothetical protein [Myxococcaceae bacterium]